MKKIPCEYCSYDNPMDNTHCNECGRKLLKQSKLLSDQEVDVFFKETSNQFTLDDFSGMTSYSKIIGMIGWIVLITGVIAFLPVSADFGFWMACLYLIGAILVSYPLIMAPILTEYLLELRREVNRNSHSNYVTTQMLQELLNTIQAMQKKDSTK